MEVKLNLNGNWLLTASRDHLCKLFDIRNLKEELQVFRGHKKEATGQQLGVLLITSALGTLLCSERSHTGSVSSFSGFCYCLTAVAWHPVHEGLFASGGSDGSLLFWHVGYVPFTVWENDNVCLYTHSHTVWQQRCLGSLVLGTLGNFGSWGLWCFEASLHRSSLEALHTAYMADWRLRNSDEEK